MKAIYVVSNRVNIIDINTSILQEVILNELRDAQSLEVLKLEEVEDEIVNITIVELHLTIARVVHVDRRDGRGDHLNELEIVNGIAFWGHQLYVMDMRAQANYQTILVSLDSRNELVCVSFVPQHFQTLEPVVSGEDVRLSNKVLVRVVI